MGWEGGGQRENGGGTGKNTCMLNTYIQEGIPMWY